MGAIKKPRNATNARQGHHNQAQLAHLEQIEQRKYDMSQVARQARHAGGKRATARDPVLFGRTLRIAEQMAWGIDQGEEALRI